MAGLLGLAACKDTTAPPGGDITYDLLFEAYPGAVPELFRRDADGGALQRLLPPGTQAMDPAPSPDGTRIAFVVGDAVEASGDIWVVDRDGSGLTQLTTDPELDDQPAWSPDGTRLAFRSFRTLREGDIWVMNADGSNAVNLTPDPLPGVTDERRPAWSPDGTRLAYAGNAGGDMDIWTLAADGSDPRRITNSPDYDTEPAWSPDGRTLVFRRSDPAGGSDLAFVPAAGGTVTRLPLSGEQRQPAWSPDGAWLVCVHQLTAAERPDLYRVTTDGAPPQALVTDAMPGGSLNPAFLRRHTPP